MVVVNNEQLSAIHYSNQTGLNYLLSYQYFSTIMDQKKQVFLIILDGFGIGPDTEGNAVYKAQTPNLNRYWTHASKKGLLHASEIAVGLDTGYTGNSEVGHINLGAGRIVSQSLQMINEQIENKRIYKNKVIREYFKKARKKGVKLHLVGCLSNAGVHSHIKHLFTLIDIANKLKIRPYIHLFLDGRDSGKYDAFFFLDKLRQKLQGEKHGIVASLVGRYYGMDRNTRWERTEKAYNALIGIGDYYEQDMNVALQKAYQRQEDDESFSPTVIVDQNQAPVGTIEDGDVVFNFNFREDRSRQITQAIVDPNFIGFERKNTLKDLKFISLIGYSESLPVATVFPTQKIENTVSAVISQAGMSQLHIGETEKYAHVSYFFNGGEEKPHANEKFFMIPSPMVKDYVETPEMSAIPITQEVLAQMDRNFYNFYLINFSNPDMVGHTGDLNMAIKAVEITDNCLGQLVDKALKNGANVIITADHGNAESMIDFEKSEPDKAHTLNPVPFMVLNKEVPENGELIKIGIPYDTIPIGVLADIGVTVLNLLGITPPEEMTGIDLSRFS